MCNDKYKAAASAHVSYIFFHYNKAANCRLALSTPAGVLQIPRPQTTVSLS